MNKKLIVVDVESDGPCPELFSMVCFGAAVVELGKPRTFYGETAPISNNWNPEALKISGFSRDQHNRFRNPQATMDDFLIWLTQLNCRPIFISDNPAFDWQWINYYLHRYLGHNPFGFSARRIGDIYAGYQKSLSGKWNTYWKKTYRKTIHDHNPVNDAIGNVEALIAFSDELGIKEIL